MEEMTEKFFLWRSDLNLLKNVLERNQTRLEDVQAEIISATLASSLHLSRPVHPEFALRFCKQLVKVVEAAGSQVHESVYAAIQHLYTQDIKSDRFFKSYFIGDIVVSLIESQHIISDGTTGLTSWTAGVHLSHWMCKQPPAWTAGKSILELGSGSGISGIFLLKKFPSTGSYTFTDVHPKVLDNLKTNLEMNTELQPTSYEVSFLDWEGASPPSHLRPDIVVGADIVFDPSLVPGLVATVKALLARKNGNAYICSTKRNEKTYDLFLSTLTAASLTWTALNLDNDENVEMLLISQSLT